MDLLRLLAAVKSQNGAAMSFGRTSSFTDIYIERDLQAGKITEQDAQEMVDHGHETAYGSLPAYPGI